MSDPPIIYRYTGPKTARRPPFPGVPMRDLTARDVARLDVTVLRTITGGASPMYVAVDPATAPVVPPAPPKLTDVKREDLDALASARGVADPAQFRTKAELVAAIEQAGAPAEQERAGAPAEQE